MTIEEAIEMLKNVYAKAELLEEIRNPVAYALYHVWKIADSRKRRRK